MKYLDKKFSVYYTSNSYKDNWEKVFKSQKSVRDMTEEEFKEFCGCSREWAQTLMLVHMHTPFPPRAMLPETKMTESEVVNYELLKEWIEKINVE